VIKINCRTSKRCLRVSVIRFMKMSAQNV